MKQKLLVFITVLAMVMSLAPMSVQAAGTGDGTSIENAYAASDAASLQSALDDPAVRFIENTYYIEYGSSLSIPSGKTLIVQPVADREFACSINYGGNLTIEAGGTLINNGGITNTNDSALIIRGSLINNAVISGVCIYMDEAGTFTNAAGALIDNRSAILFYSGSIANAGTISCLINQIGTDAECVYSGIDGSIIRNSNAPVNYTEMPYKTLNLPENDTTTVGMSGDNSTLIFAPDNYLIFAMGYKVALQEGQTIVVQQSSDFTPYLYLVMDDGNMADTSSLGGLRYTASHAETVTIVAGGYDTIYVGSLNVTVYDPAVNTNGGLDFVNVPDSASGDGWEWDSAAQTLTLSGLMLSAVNSNGITLPDGSTIVLADGSENFIQTNYSAQGPAIMAPSPDSTRTGVYCIGSLTIIGSGNLTINGSENGLTCDGILAINEQGTLYFGGDGDNGIFAAEGIVIEDCFDLSAFGGRSGISSGGVIQIFNSSIVAHGWSFGIMTGTSFASEATLAASIAYAGGNIEITNSQIDASCSLEPDSGAALYAGDDNYDANSGVHSKIIINNGGILLPLSGSICNVAIINQPRCQTISSIEGLAQVTSWAQAAKAVMLMSSADMTYDDNGGSGTMEDAASPYLRSDEVTILANQFTRTGYTFAGWNTEADGSGTSYAPAAVFTINNDTTLYAMWEINTFTVTFADWDGTVLSTQTVDYGDPAMAPAMPSRTGYQFDEWDSDFSVISADRTITALYSLITITTPTTTPTAAPTQTATPTPTLKPAVLAAVKTGETGSTGTAAAIFIVSAIGIFAVQLVLRRKVRE